MLLSVLGVCIIFGVLKFSVLLLINRACPSDIRLAYVCVVSSMGLYLSLPLRLGAGVIPEELWLLVQSSVSPSESVDIQPSVRRDASNGSFVRCRPVSSQTRVSSSSPLSV